MRIPVLAFLTVTAAAPGLFAQALPMSAAGAAASARPSLAAMEARLAFARGPVEVTPAAAPGASARPGSTGETLARGARVRVGDGGYAEIALANGATLGLQDGAQLLLFASPTPPAQGQPPSTTTTLLRGAMQVAASTAGNEARLVPVATASTTVFVGRADALVTAELGGHITRIAVHRGRMRVRAGAREYIVRAGSGVQEELGRPRPPIRQLLPQVAWHRAPPERVVSGGEPLEVGGTYGVRTAAPVGRWRVTVARDAAFRDVITSERVAPEVTRWQRWLEPGEYFVRVAAVDADRFEGAPSAAARVVVAAPSVVPGRAAAPSEPGRVAAVNVPAGFYCGLDGAALAPIASPLRLVPGRRHQLRCATSAEGSDVREIAIPSSRSGPLGHEIRMRGVAYGESVLAVRLTDAEGHEVPYADIRVATDRGVEIDPIREAPARGVYNAAVRWPRGVDTARFRFTVNGEEVFEEELSRDQ